MLVRGNLGLASVLSGDIDAARRAFREQVRLCRELTVLVFASEGLCGLAAVATARGEPHRAARLCGAAAAHRYGQPEDRVDRRLDATFFERVRTEWGSAAWDAAFREGAALSFDDAIAFALDETLS